MKLTLVFLIAFIAVAIAEVDLLVEGNDAYGYLERDGVPAAKKRKEAESELQSRIVGGLPAGLGQYPWQAGLLISLVGLNATAICGGSLLTNNRVVTAAHCWWDGRNQAWRFTVVLGSVFLFTGGTRLDTSVIVTHPNWNPFLVRNDIGVIFLPTPVTFSNTIAPISLPSGAEVQEDFAGQSAIASGFGLTRDGGSLTTGQYLSHVRLNVITNTVCSLAFPVIFQPDHICTSGVVGVGTCRGDSGGPLFITRNNRNILIGVTSFGHSLGCEANFPSGFARVTSYVGFLNQHL